MQPWKRNERTRDYTITDSVKETTADARKNLPVKVFMRSMPRYGKTFGY